MSFLDRVRALPRLGLGLSTEYGAGGTPGALDPRAVRAENPRWAGFLEIGVEVEKGLDAPARAWVADGHPTTWHFLDINLDEPEDFDAAWLAGLRAGVEAVKPAWLCGDAGMWHFGPRDRGQMLLLPPVLTAASADALARGVARLRAATGKEVLPENPPGTVYLGDLHLLDFFARVSDAADTGLLLDVAHLAIYQRATGRTPLDGLDGFPLDRVVELHVAGGTERDHQGYAWVDDDHSPLPLADTWRILDRVLPHTPNLKAVVLECERNPLDAVRGTLTRLDGRLPW